MKIPETRYTWPVVIHAPLHFWNGEPGGGCLHGPASQSWPPGKLVSWIGCRLQVHPPCEGWRLWIYTLWGALQVDVVIDRREWKRPR